MLAVGELALIQDFRRVWESNKSLQKEKALRWHTPPPGIVKLNVDGAIFQDVQKAGVGAILQDEKESVIMDLGK